MTYRIIEGDIYHVVDSPICCIGDQYCVFYRSENFVMCSREPDPDTLKRPCVADNQSIIFLDDKQMLRLLSLRLKQ
jgi:hypothetical protein